jgi:hypothetical protein
VWGGIKVISIIDVYIHNIIYEKVFKQLNTISTITL